MPGSPVITKKPKHVAKPTWCPGCGDFGVLSALQSAVAALKIASKDLLVVSGIGCSSDLPGFIHSYAFHGLHGRSVPVATGAHLANTALQVVITGGDGDGYGIGLGHFVHAMRRNLDLTYLVMDNQIYGLTTGQTSPTTTLGHVTKSTPAGNVEHPLNPLALALISGATFVARGFSGEAAHLTEIVKQALQHKGFALIDIFSPCITYNKLNTYEWFRKRVYKLEDKGHDATNFEAALTKSREWGEAGIPIGILYRASLPTYADQDAVLKAGPLVNQPVGLTPDQQKSIHQEFL